MRYFLITLLILYSGIANSQDSLSNSVRSLRVSTGLPFQKVVNTSDWHQPDFELGFDFQHSIRLKNSFFASFGLGLNYSQYRTEAYFQQWQTIAYSPLQGSTINTYVDDYERQTLGRFMTIRVPVQLEYMPTGKWKPYARLGVVFDSELIHQSVEVYANTLKPAPDHVHATPNRVYSDDYLLSAISSGGIKYQMGNSALLFGLYGQVAFWNFNKEREFGRVGLGAEFTFRKTIRQSDLTFNEVESSDSYRRRKRDYVYLEVFGSSFASFNFELNVVGKNLNGLNAKVGLGAGPNGAVLPAGLSWVFGGRRGCEVGFDVVIDLPDYSDSYFVPRVGYRWEFDNSILMRLNLAGWWTTSFSIAPGFSIGKCF